jgi:hypothetical protein
MLVHSPMWILGAKLRVFIDWTIRVFERNPFLKPDEHPRSLG